MKKNVLMIGCNGEIGRTLYEKLSNRYNWILCDISENKFCFPKFHKVDFTNRREIEDVFNNKIDVVISLIGLPEASNIPDPILFDKMTHTYFYSTFYILDSMRKTGVKKFILASSNHVTDYYENNGYSILGREINTQDYPKNTSVYASLKLASESLCHNYFINYGIESISFRIGSFRRIVDKNTMPDRWNRTILKIQDLVEAFTAAIEKKSTADVYYLVSDNADKPWNTSDLKELLTQE